jgi:5-formyltetrahydrofolate cyclo-ligase
MNRYQIDRDSPIPAYYQIMLDLRDRITRGEWRAGSKLPTEPELAAEYSVSRMTLRQAMAELVKDGLLDRHPGAGTFVTQGYMTVDSASPTGGSVLPQNQQDKFALRQAIWDELREVALPDSRLHWNFEEFVPDFVGSELCVQSIVDMEWYRASNVIFIAPDNSLIGMRQQAIKDQKRVLVATYALKRGFRLLEAGSVPVGAEQFAATLDGLEVFGREISLEDISALGIDLLITGISLVTREGVRWGKGHGYFDLEWAIFREVQAVGEDTPVIAVGHDCQLVSEVLEPSAVDTIADAIVTPTAVIRVPAVYPKPEGIYWEYVSPQLRQFIPLLQTLFTQRRENDPAGGMNHEQN